MNKKIAITILVAVVVIFASVGVYFALKKPTPVGLQNNKPVSQNGKCGDGICDAKEKANPNLCPKDCNNENAISPAQNTTPAANPAGAPYYVINIHANPVGVLDAQSNGLEKAYGNVKKEVDYANKYNIKLSVWLSAPVAKYIAEDSTRLTEVKSWISQSHEIGLHHHSTYRPTEWDGYSSVSQSEAEAIRIKLAGKVEPWGYQGSLDDLMAILKKVNPKANSGVCSESYNFSESIPNDIIYLTGSAFLNTGEVGTKMKATNDILNIQNDYVLTGVVNGIERKWISNYDLRTVNEIMLAEGKFNSITSGIFSVVTHNSDGNVLGLEKLMDYIHAQDPNGNKSRTVPGAIEEKLVPEKALPENLLQ